MAQSQLAHEIVKNSVPFVDAKDFIPLIDNLKDKKLVLLGEGTHGTREFYEWRNLISAELIKNHGFNFIAVEGDWPACQEINRFIQHKNQLDSFETLSVFTRWPTWLWSNAEMILLMDWLKDWNEEHEKMIGFHGLDVYSLFESIDDTVRQLADVNHKLARKIKNLYSCFEPYWHNERAYARSLFNTPEGCTKQVTLAYEEILKFYLRGSPAYFEATQNARVIKNVTNYYQAMVFSARDESWNVRENHMLETLEMLFDHYGAHSKGIVWAHNSHVGDHRAAEMSVSEQLSLGGLSRKVFGPKNVSLVGLTSYSGQFIASHSWEGPIQVMKLPRAKSGSLEYFLHNAIPQVGYKNYYLTFDDIDYHSALNAYRGHRGIGVVYDSEHESKSNYIPTAVGNRYDALVFFDESKPIRPLVNHYDTDKIPDTFPFGSRI